ncbi:MAG: SLC45 family MFS transporter [Leptolyngbya sp. SIO1D8]|nr:SLC45 family MFS transporter [Leptolyngbya sp. SIO1D8]
MLSKGASEPARCLYTFDFCVSSQFAKQAHGKVLWAQVCGLAAVQGAIALLWVIYNLYLVDLLGRLGFSTALATGLLIVENLLAVVMEPLMGSLSDRLQQQLGTRFPLVSLGVILSAGTFMAIPAISLAGPEAALRWILPLMMVTWALAMTVFRSPALSLLGRYAFGTRLPQAASILTLVGGVAGAMGPLASQVILAQGPMVAFTLGSVVLLLAAGVLRFSRPSESLTTEPNQVSESIAESRSISWYCLALVFGAGVGVTFGFRLLMTLFTKVLNSQVTDANTSLVMGSIFVSLALTAIPAGTLATRLGNRRAMVLGLAGMAFVFVLIGIVRQNSLAVTLALLFGATFSLVSNGTIPFALSMVPTPKAGLGTGIYFGGGAAASSLFGAIVEKVQAMPPSLGTLLGVSALLVAGICIARAPRQWVPAPVDAP